MDFSIIIYPLIFYLSASNIFLFFLNTRFLFCPSFFYKILLFLIVQRILMILNIQLFMFFIWKFIVFKIWLDLILIVKKIILFIIILIQGWIWYFLFIRLIIIITLFLLKVLRSKTLWHPLIILKVGNKALGIQIHLRN
jgi:hypothetical protein